MQKYGKQNDRKRYRQSHMPTEKTSEKCSIKKNINEKLCQTRATYQKAATTILILTLISIGMPGLFFP